MISIIGSIFSVLCLVFILWGVSLTMNVDEKKVVLGWLFMTIGITCNGIGCLLHGHYVLAAFSFAIGVWDLNIYNERNKEYELNNLNAKEMFFNEIRKRSKNGSTRY